MNSLAAALHATPHLPTLSAILVGTLLLLFGRRLFWLFVGAAGFASGLEFATIVFRNQAEWMLVVAALVCGLAGMLIAFFLQKLAISLGGFLAGAYLSISLAQTFWPHETGAAFWLAIVVGGLIGAVLMQFVFKGALIVLSSIFGASLIIQSNTFLTANHTVALLILILIGLVFQLGIRPRARA